MKDKQRIHAMIWYDIKKIYFENGADYDNNMILI